MERATARPLVAGLWLRRARRTASDRIETARLVSRLLCFLGALAWAGGLFLVADNEPAWSLSTLRASLVGLLTASLFLGFPPFVFITSFARNDSLGFLLVCLTFLASVLCLRHGRDARATTGLVVVAALGFWGHLAAMLFSLAIAFSLLLVGALRARREGAFGPFLKAWVRGIAMGLAILALLMLAPGGSSAGGSAAGSEGVLAEYSGRLVSNLAGAGDSLRDAFRKWLEWPEIAVAFVGACVALGLWGLAVALKLVNGSSPLRLVGGLLAQIVLFLAFTLLAGSLMRTYTLHDVYRPLLLAAYVSVVVLSLQIAVPPGSSAGGQLALVAVLANAIGLSWTAQAERAKGGGFPRVPITWDGYRPFHDASERSGSESATEHTVANVARRAHLRELLDYLKRREIDALVTLDPMVLILQARAWTLTTSTQSRFQMRPATLGSASAIFFRTRCGKTTSTWR